MEDHDNGQKMMHFCKIPAQMQPRHAEQQTEAIWDLVKRVSNSAPISAQSQAVQAWQSAHDTVKFEHISGYSNQLDSLLEACAPTAATLPQGASNRSPTGSVMKTSSQESRREKEPSLS